MTKQVFNRSDKECMKGVTKMCAGVRVHEVCMQLGEQTGTKKLRKQVQTFYEFQLLTQIWFKLLMYNASKTCSTDSDQA